MTPKGHPSARRKAEEKKEAEDIFVEKVLELTQWTKANSQAVMFGVFVLVVVVAGSIYYLNYRSSLKEQAVAQLEQVQSTLGFGDRDLAKGQLDRYLNQFEGTVYALEARLLLGQIRLEDNDPQGALDVLAPAVRAMDDHPIGIQAGFLMAAAYEELDRKDDAERLLLRIADTSELTFQIREALSGAARLRAETGDNAGAAELYRDVLATMELGDPARSYWEMRLAETSARG